MEVFVGNALLMGATHLLQTPLVDICIHQGDILSLWVCCSVWALLALYILYTDKNQIVYLVRFAALLSKCLLVKFLFTYVLVVSRDIRFITLCHVCMHVILDFLDIIKLHYFKLLGVFVVPIYMLSRQTLLYSDNQNIYLGHLVGMMLCSMLRLFNKLAHMIIMYYYEHDVY